ncbi:MAG: SPOR domain-containing protein [Bauldia sp.]|nr:SPOR domain-containing protein [Bauldia sp.]
MTGRSGFGSSGRDQAPEPAESPDAGQDLESELLNDLQASFAALGGPFQGQPAQASRPEAPLPEARPAPVLETRPEPPRERWAEPPRAAEEPDRLTLDFEKSVEEVLAELESANGIVRQPPPEPEPMPEPEPEPEPQAADDHEALAGLESFAPFPLPELRFEPEEPTLPLPPSLPPVDREPPPPYPEPELPPPAALARRDREAPPPVRRPQPPEPANAPAPPPREARRPRPRPPEAEERPNPSRLRLRPAPPPVRPIEGDADEPAAETPPRKERMTRALRPRERSGGFAPPRAVAPPPEEPAPEPRAGRSDPGPFAEPPELEDPNGGFDEGFSLDDLDTAAFAPEDDLPPFPEEELAGLKRRRTGRTFAVIAGVLLIAVIGAGAFYMTQGESGSGSPPPIITADGGPSKVFPEEAATDSDQQSKLIYDRVDDGGGSDTTLVASGDDAIVEVTPDEDMTDNPISRVIIPGGPGIDGPIQEGDDPAGGEAVVADVDPSDAGDDGLGPKKVRTVVVRPDGTIVSSEAVEEGGDAIPGDEAPDAVAGDEFSNLAKDTRTDMDAVLDGQDLPVVADPLGVTTGTPVAGDPAPGTVPAEDQEVVAVETEPEPVPVAVPEPAKPKAAPTPAKPAKPTIVATTGDANGPIDLTPGSSARSSAPQAGSGGVLVQVSAQRSEEAARSTYKSLQARYPSILGRYQAAIVRADLGDRGVYFRVRVGPFSSNDATRLCNDLKSAGGDCILAR